METLLLGIPNEGVRETHLEVLAMWLIICYTVARRSEWYGRVFTVDFCLILGVMGKPHCRAML